MEKIKINSKNNLLSIPIDKSMKKHSSDPVIRKKIERAKETLSKVKNLNVLR